MKTGITEDDRPTHVPCQRCHGEGALRTVIEHGVTYSTITEPDMCWVCEGRGSIPIVTLRAWIVAGRPIKKPENW